MSLDHVASRRHGVLLILRCENIGAEFSFHVIQHVYGLSCWVKWIVNLAKMITVFSDLDPLILLGNCRELQHRPVIGASQQLTCEIIRMEALHYDYDRAGPLVVQTRKES